ncbi:hypothetical protein [Pontibacter sp. SGAir0037]|uniref:hypothetical protein n=1 Tax=Pontibacter sp. SGAir0037 TaxID=2571030 RepID=UPI0010CCF0B9|nr:hypothetical protein [Pontibacter sp. SGAir0037]QCR20928.1 hypothetical protein C1N53_00160 [Pontibacter sp. SGAir0037]
MKLTLIVTAIFLSVLALIFFAFKDKLLEPPSDSVSETLEILAPLPEEVKESSGIVALPEQGQFLTHNDAGNKPQLYQLSSEGKIVKTFKLNVPNVDWEDLAKDNKGNLYIADTGNNANKRKELAIYKTSLNNPSKAEAIRFTYEDQEEYPPSKKEMNFDCEAIFWHDGSLYLISKDRGRKETAKIYQLPDQPGNYKAKLLGSHKLQTQITGASISPEADKVALVSNEKLHLFRNVDDPAAFYKGDYKEIDLSGTGQTEAVDFIDANTLIMTSESGSLYQYKLSPP